jgi:rubrerythrin
MSKEGLLKALTDAIRAEVEGHAFYLMAAKSTSDPLGKQVFERLAGEELEHATFLRSHYDSIEQTGRVSSARLGVPAVPAGSPIFSAELRNRIAEAHFEMTALSVGAQLEQGAMEFYSAQADAAEDPAVAQLFRELAEWERGHYRTLVAQLDSLRDDFWGANRFSPF